MRKLSSSHPFFRAPLLVFIICVFMIFLQFASFGADSENVVYAVMLLLQTVTFAIPALFYCIINGRDFAASLPICLPKMRSLPVIVSGTLLLILTACVLKFGIFHFAYDYSVYSLYGSAISLDTTSFLSVLLIVLSLAVFPALTEEFVFRGIVMREYSRCGAPTAMVMSSLLFSFIHFDLRQFPIYFILGMILSWLVYLTKSVIAPLIAHTVYNLFAIFAEKYVWLFSSNPDSDILFFLILVALTLVCLFFFLTAGEKALFSHAQREEAVAPTVKKEQRPAMYFYIFTSVPFIADVLIFLIVGIVLAV